MRLYPMNDAVTVVDHPEHGEFKIGKHGGFDFPDELSDELHSFCHRGEKLWESETERRARQHGDDLARRRDPAALYDAVGDVTGAFQQIAAALNTRGGDDASAKEIEDLKKQVAELQAAADEAQSGAPAESGAPKGKTTPASPAKTTAKTAS